MGTGERWWSLVRGGGHWCEVVVTGKSGGIVTVTDERWWSLMRDGGH